jgi:hypothetical protein
MTAIRFAVHMASRAYLARPWAIVADVVILAAIAVWVIF